VYRWEAPLFFANAGIFRQQVRRLVREQHPAWVVLQCEAITDIDVTAAEMLEQLDKELNAAGVHIAFAELRDRLQDLTVRYGLFETLDRDHFYPTLKAAVREVEELGPLPPGTAAPGGHGHRRRKRGRDRADGEPEHQ
jgi:MFS superfamily sulfate permease-like transporter